MIKTLRLLNEDQALEIIERAEGKEKVSEFEWLNLIYTISVDPAVFQLVSIRFNKLKASK